MMTRSTEADPLASAVVDVVTRGGQRRFASSALNASLLLQHVVLDYQNFHRPFAGFASQSLQDPRKRLTGFHSMIRGLHRFASQLVNAEMQLIEKRFGRCLEGDLTATFVVSRQLQA
jgi:hypothetical protein